MFGLNYVKIIAVLALSAMLFFAGWTVNGWRWDSKYTDRENTLQAQYSKSLTDYSKKLQDQEYEAREAATELQGKQLSLATTITKLKEQAKHGHFTRTQPPVVPGGVVCDYAHPYTVELPRALNGLSAVADGTDVPAAASPAPSPDGTTPAASATSALDGGALVDWYADVARLYGQCKAQLDAIRKWDAKP